MSRRKFHSTFIALSFAALSPSLAMAQINTPSFGRTYTSTTSRAVSIDTETVRERYPNGKIHIERQVALDDNSNFINHGTYQEFTVNGDLAVSGQYTQGKRSGTWIKVCPAAESPLFATYPYSKFAAPYQSSVEFNDDKMNGIWVIQDAQNKIVSQINLEDGQRHGISTWFHPSGEIQFEAEYTNGLLNGRFVEKDIKGTIVREDNFVNGQRSVSEKEFFKNKAVKVEAEYLSAPNSLVTPDDFFKSQVANYDNKGAKVLHGQFRAFFENGQVKTVCSYSKGVLDNNFETFFQNGQQAVEGEYKEGVQVGKWTWWHENGMRKALVSYQSGKPNGEVLAWNESGVRIKSTGVVPGVEAPQSIGERQVPVRTLNGIPQGIQE